MVQKKKKNYFKTTKLFSTTSDNIVEKGSNIILASQQAIKIIQDLEVKRQGCQNNNKQHGGSNVIISI